VERAAAKRCLIPPSLGQRGRPEPPPWGYHQPPIRVRDRLLSFDQLGGQSLRHCSKVMRRLAIAVGLVATGLAAGSAATAAARHPGATTCGIPYVFHVDRQRILSGSCAGELPAHPPSVTIREGTRFWVEIAHEQSGKLDYPVPTPGSQAVQRTSRHRSRVYYLAHRGLRTTKLFAHGTRSCPSSNPKIGGCAVLKVRVAPRLTGAQPAHDFR
jgi:hypothetical protein